MKITEFANFRNVKGKNIGSGILFRSHNPSVKQYVYGNRYMYADKLVGKHGINTIINLSQNDDGLRTKTDPEKSPNSYMLLTQGQISAIKLDGNKMSGRSFKESLREHFRFMSTHKGPYLIHCAKGQDRTGFMIAVCEMLMGVKYDRIVSDYMKSYENYYGVKKNSVLYRYLAGSLRDSIQEMTGSRFKGKAIKDLDLSKTARLYMRYDLGLTPQEINRIRQNLEGSTPEALRSVLSPPPGYYRSFSSGTALYL